MNKAKKEITEALRILSALSVNGDAVDLMAAAKAHLREALKLAETPADTPEEAAKDG